MNDFPEPEWGVEIGYEVFILGYPNRISVDTTPIWKRGSIATEPQADVDGLPAMLVDTAGMSGLSGSPVIYRGGRRARVNNGYMYWTPQQTTLLVGIYTGRLNVDRATPSVAHHPQTNERQAATLTLAERQRKLEAQLEAFENRLDECERKVHHYGATVFGRQDVENNFINVDWELGAQLGRVWKRQVIDEIINGKQRGSMEACGTSESD